MSQRKVIRFGKSAFCVTLPQTWVRKNKLQKGDVVNVEETPQNSLEIVIGTIESTDSTEIEVNITHKSVQEINDLLLALYLNGYTMITLHGTNVGKVTDIRNYVHEFIAAEIMEVTSTIITINVFWDIKGIQLNAIISRIGHITKSMSKDLIELLDRQHSITDIVDKGHEAQRQVLFAQRAIKYALNNSPVAQDFDLTPFDLLHFFYIVYFHGIIAEYLIQMAEIIHSATEESFEENGNKSLQTVLSNAMDYYGQVLYTYKTQDHKKPISPSYQDIHKQVRAFKSKHDASWNLLVAEYIQLLILKIRDAEFMVLSMQYAP